MGSSEVSGRGRIYSFTVVRQAFDPSFAEGLPYVVALIEIEEDRTVRVLSNVVDVDPGQVEVGMPVKVSFEKRGDTVLPVFRPATSDGRVQ
jgi:uncharacterized OB-fold protein